MKSEDGRFSVRKTSTGGYVLRDHKDLDDKGNPKVYALNSLTEARNKAEEIISGKKGEGKESRKKEEPKEKGDPFASGELKVNNTGSNIDVNFTHQKTFKVGGQDVRANTGMSGGASALIDDKRKAIVVSRISVSDGLEGQGISTAMLAELAKEAQKMGYKLETTDVLSKKGKAYFEHLADKGLGEKNQDGSFTLYPGALVRDHGKFGRKEGTGPPAQQAAKDLTPEDPHYVNHDLPIKDRIASYRHGQNVRAKVMETVKKVQVKKDRIAKLETEIIGAHRRQQELIEAAALDYWRKNWKEPSLLEDEVKLLQDLTPEKAEAINKNVKKNRGFSRQLPEEDRKVYAPLMGLLQRQNPRPDPVKVHFGMTVPAAALEKSLAAFQELMAAGKGISLDGNLQLASTDPKSSEGHNVRFVVHSREGVEIPGKPGSWLLDGSGGFKIRSIQKTGNEMVIRVEERVKSFNVPNEHLYGSEDSKRVTGQINSMYEEKARLEEEVKKASGEARTLLHVEDGVRRVPMAEFDPGRHVLSIGEKKWTRPMSERTSEAHAFIRSICAKGSASGLDIPTLKFRTATKKETADKGYRSNYQSKTYFGLKNYGTDAVVMDVGAGTDTYVHEIGHFLEDRVPGVHEAVKEFMRHRLKGETPQQLKKLFPGHGFKDDEYGAKDEFDKVWDGSAAYYVGKPYPTLNRATELVSMGVEQMYRDPVRLAEKDPELFDFLVGILHGDLRRDQKTLERHEEAKKQGPARKKEGARSSPSSSAPEPQAPSFSPAETQALTDYTGGSAFRLNAALREKSPLSGRLADMDKSLQEAFAKATPRAEPRTLYRGLPVSPQAAEAFAQEAEKAMKDGRPIVNPGYSSTTTKKEDVSDVPLSMSISTRHGIDMSGVSKNPAEAEVLLDKGQSFRVKKVTKRPDGGYHLDLEHVEKEK
jgi:predicted GNAT family acetyltransferase